MQGAMNDSESCRTCAASGNLKACSRCKAAKYCSTECQKADWKEHKKNCAAPIRLQLPPPYHKVEVTKLHEASVRQGDPDELGWAIVHTLSTTGAGAASDRVIDEVAALIERDPPIPDTWRWADFCQKYIAMSDDARSFAKELRQLSKDQSPVPESVRQAEQPLKTRVGALFQWLFPFMWMKRHEEYRDTTKTRRGP